MPTFDYTAWSTNLQDTMGGIDACRRSNAAVLPLLKQIAQRDFFSYYAVNLITPCMYFPTEDAGCEKCEAGSYSAVVGLDAARCAPCPAGRASSAEGARSSSTCTPCAIGSFAATSGLESCVPCPWPRAPFLPAARSTDHTATDTLQQSPAPAESPTPTERTCCNRLRGQSEAPTSAH